MTRKTQGFAAPQNFPTSSKSGPSAKKSGPKVAPPRTPVKHGLGSIGVPHDVADPVYKWLLMVHGFCRQCFRQNRAKFFMDSAASFSAKAVPSFAGNWTPRGSLFPCKFLKIFVAESLTIWVASLSTKLPKPFVFKPFWRACQILGP